MQYTVTTTRDISKIFDDLPFGQRRFFELLLRRIGEKSVSNIQENYLTGQALNIRSGHLRTKTLFKMKNAYSMEVANVAKYAAIHEFGGDIYPKKAKALRFKIGNQWVVTKHVKMPKRPFVKPGVDEIIKGPAAMRLFDSVFEKVMREGGWK